jgi:FtsZ-interacting cell division protein ZipA
MVYVYTPGREAPNGELGANDQITLLRRLSTFVGKEAIPVTVIFPGRPTRKIPDGTSQDGVKARYATSDQMKKVVSSAIAEAKKTHSAVLATNNPDLEKLARSERIRHIHATTFEQALDNICGPIRREQQQQHQQRRQQQQPQNQTPAAKPQPGQQQEQPGPQEQPERQEQSGEEASQAPSPQTQVQPPAPRQEQPGLQRHRRADSSMKKEERDQSILDLIDPL